MALAIKACIEAMIGNIVILSENDQTIAIRDPDATFLHSENLFRS